MPDNKPQTKKKLMTREDRRQAGQLCRNKIKRVDQADWNPKNRKFDVIDLLLGAQHGRVPELLPIKWAHMAASPFGFFRGAVPLMAADLATLPRTDLMAHLCGDAHVQNLGAFEAPDGRLIFDINDFDETIIGPWEWDVKRMSASLVLAGREAGNSDKQCKDAVLAFVRSYRVWMGRFSEMPWVDLARFQIYREVSPVRSVLRNAERATPPHNLKKLTVLRDGKHVFRKPEPPIPYKVSQKEKDDAVASLRAYKQTLLPERAHFFSQYEVEDVTFRVVGTGSVGLRDYVLLMFGGAVYDPLFIQIKEEPKSAYAPYLPDSPVPAHQGQRTAEGGRAMQMQSDVFLGWTSIAGRDYVVRQLRDHKAGITAADLKGKGLVEYAQMCGELLSKGHARSGNPCAIYGYLGNSDRFDKAMATFGVSYADDATNGWAALKRAIRDGKIQAAKTAPPTKKGKQK
jgi:uncharacterized protein (DUF2252 family)